MGQLRLKTQLLISTLLIICALTGAILLIVRHTVRSEIDEQVREGTVASVDAFQAVQQERELELSRTAAMLSQLPTLKALMSTQHAPTIQDGSFPFWQVAGSDLFLLADPAGHVQGLHVTRPGLNSTMAEGDLARSVKEGDTAAWWYAAERLYWVFFRTITAGAGSNAKQLGLVAIGYEVDSTVAKDLARVSDSKIVLAAGDKVIASSLSPQEEVELQRLIRLRRLDATSAAQEVVLSGAEYQMASVALHDGPPWPVQCYVLVSLRRPMSFIHELNRTILVLGISAVLFAWLLVSSVSCTITRPVDNLVAGVRALAAGDYAYSITPRGSSEVAELGEAFSRMRGELLVSQRQRIEAERVAALGRAASSISHDLRHYLATVVANAEFLYEAEKLKLKKSEIYEEIKTAANQMTDLIDSLRELSSQRTVVFPERADLALVIRHAAETIRARPEFRNAQLVLVAQDQLQGVFDPRKLERVFFNLFLNACEATGDRDCKVTVDARKVDES